MPMPNVTFLTCKCGGRYPHSTLQGPSNYCPHCGGSTPSHDMCKYLNRVLGARRARNTLRRTSLRYRLNRGY